MAETNYSDWSVENTVIAILLLLGNQGEVTNNLPVLSTKIRDLIRRGVLERASNWGLQKTAAGYYSRTLDEWLGASIIAGDILALNRFKEIKLTQSGVKICKEIVASSWRNGDQGKMLQIMEALGIKSIEELLNPLPEGA